MKTKKGVIREINREAFYEIVTKIPKGRVATYGQLAKLTGIKSPRYVGYLLHRNPNPSKIPCHRVVNSRGELAKNYALGGVNAQKEKLYKDGVESKNNRVDLKKYLWIN